jgi:hypothetical protein
VTLAVQSGDDAFDFGRFSWLTDTDSTRYYFGKAIGVGVYELDAYALATAHPSAPLRIEWGAGGRMPSDIVWTGLCSPLVSARVRNLIAPFTGWTTYPVEVHDGWGTHVPGYAGLAFAGRCGRAVADLSRVEGGGGRAHYVGLRFDPGSWDGSDFFVPERSRRLVITRSVGEVLRTAKVGNVRWLPLSEVRSGKAWVDHMIADRRGPYAEDGP